MEPTGVKGFGEWTRTIILLSAPQENRRHALIGDGLWRADFIAKTDSHSRGKSTKFVIATQVMLEPLPKVPGAVIPSGEAMRQQDPALRPG
jgi:hypothetical protein